MSKPRLNTVFSDFVYFYSCVLLNSILQMLLDVKALFEKMPTMIDVTIPKVNLDS